jgi:hypothetical protein
MKSESVFLYSFISKKGGSGKDEEEQEEREIKEREKQTINTIIKRIPFFSSKKKLPSSLFPIIIRRFFLSYSAHGILFVSFPFYFPIISPKRRSREQKKLVPVGNS